MDGGEQRIQTCWKVAAMTIQPDIDTDFAQFQDTMDIGRRSTDEVQIEDCDTEGCNRIVLVERRLDRHRKDIDELKTLIQSNGEAVKKNSADTAEILEIVTLGKSFFKVLGWIGEKIKTILAIGGAIGAFVLWIKAWPKL
jgi:hypothetical protein